MGQNTAIEDDVYSYHTFFLPLIWKGCSKEQENMASFAEIFEKNDNNWEDQNIGNMIHEEQSCPPWYKRVFAPICPKDRKRNENNQQLPARFQNETSETAYSFYKEYAYFYPHVRRALYGEDNSIVRNFAFKPGKQSIQNRAKYILTKGSKKYTLIVNSINMMIFHTGVALFIMECENHGGENGSQCNLAAVKAINEYGRRINWPFIPAPNNSSEDSNYFSLCADIQELLLPGGESFAHNYLAEAKAISETTDDMAKAKKILKTSSMTYISSMIRKILETGTKYHFTSHSGRKKENTIYIYPALDDRMFVASYIIDNNKVDTFLNDSRTENQEACSQHIDDEYSLPYMKDPEIQKSLYELLFLDLNHECSCQSSDMRKQLLQEHIYKRWLDYGSITGISAQALVTIAQNPPKHVIESFLVIYNRMIAMGLAQRASLTLFETELSAVSSNCMNHNFKKMKRSSITRIITLRQKFIIYQSHLGFSDITSEEQGIEYWDLIKTHFRIDQSTDSLSRRLEALHEAADTDMNYGLNVLAIILGILAVIDIVNALMDGEHAARTLFTTIPCLSNLMFLNPQFTYLGIGIFFGAVTIILVVCAYHRRK